MPEMINLIPNSFEAVEATNDFIKFSQTFTDAEGCKYETSFFVRNENIGLVNKALKCLIPVKSI